MQARQHLVLGRARGCTTVQTKGQTGKLTDEAGSEALDESVRCRMSGICEGSLACKPGSDEALGCITNSTERQGKVKEAMLWSWKGYRCTSSYYEGRTALIKLVKMCCYVRVKEWSWKI